MTWNFVNSTLDAADNAIFSTAGGDKAGNVAGVTMQTLNINKATIINPVKKCFQHRQNNQKWLRYILTNSLVVVNSEKPNFVAEMNAGSQGANPTWQVSGNVFQQMTDGVCVDVSDKQNNGDPDEPIVNSVAGVMTFNSLETPDFGGTFQLPATTTSTPSAFGDPRWTIEVLSAENNEHLDVTIDHERMAGLGYSASKATVDFTAAKELLGVEELTDDMLYIVNADGTLVKNFADFDGWFNVEGVAEDWFSLNAEGNVRPGLCVKFFQALDGGEFEICDMNGADEVGKTYTVKWRLTNGYKYVDYTINVKFVEFSIPEYKPEIVKTIDVPAHLITGIIYEGASASFDVNEVTSALGIESIADAKMYVVNVTDGNFVTDIYDGWRNAEGESAEWNSSTGMVAVQIHDPASGSIDWMGAIDDTHNVGDTYTAKVGFANSEDKAVVLNVNITFAGLYLVGNFTDWAVNDIYAMTLNYEQKETDEFMVTANLAADAWFKVVKYDGSNIVAWYPDGTGNAYGENGELSQGAGIYDVYFRPYADGNDDWFYNYIYVEYDADATTGIDAVAAEMQNGTVYNMQGMRVDRPTKGLYIVNGKKVVIK